MIVKPGQQIPFWLRLPKSAGDLYPVVHLTSSLTGIDEVGSPYPLTYSGNRDIYTGVGPEMGMDILVADYVVFKDSGLTQLNSQYFIDSDYIEPGLTSISVGSNVVVNAVTTQVNVTVSPPPQIDLTVEVSPSNPLIVNQNNTQVSVIETSINLEVDD